MKAFGIVGWKNSGKTGLVERLVADLTARKLRISTIKHAHHAFEIDRPGKDSFRHRTAGASQVLVSSSQRWALMRELRDEEEPTLETLLSKLDPVHLVLVEGYKGSPLPRLEAWRAACGVEPLALEDTAIRAVAADQSVSIDRPVFDLNDTRAIADFILAEVGL